MKVKVRVKTSTFMKVGVETHLLLHQKGSESESISKSIYLCSIRIFHESESGDSSSCQTFQKHNFQLKVNLKWVFLKYDMYKVWIKTNSNKVSRHFFSHHKLKKSGGSIEK